MILEVYNFFKWMWGKIIIFEPIFLNIGVILTVTPTNNTGAGLLFHSMKTTFYLVFIAIEI